jgi:hypothetical protein
MLEISSGDWPQCGGPDLSGPLTQVTAQSGVRVCPSGCWTWLESGGILVGNVFRWLGGSRAGWTRPGSSSFISTTAYCTAEKRRSTRLEGVKGARCSKWHFPILQVIDWPHHLREAWLSTEARFNRAWFGPRSAIYSLDLDSENLCTFLLRSFISVDVEHELKIRQLVSLWQEAWWSINKNKRLNSRLSVREGA